MSEWISVNDRLPSEHGLYFVLGHGGTPFVSLWVPDKGWHRQSASKQLNGVSHWMAVPELSQYIGPYKGYIGSVEHEGSDYFGEVQGIKAAIYYESDSMIWLIKEFQYSVDNYLRICEKEGLTPEVPK